MVPNTYIVAMDYAIQQTENFDFQDNVYIVSNITPTTAPPAPTNLTATSAAAPTLSWTGVTYSNLSGYNVYRSTSVNGTFTELNASPVTTTSYTDNSAPSGTALYYRVTAVDATTGNESAPATATANTPTGPFATPDAFTAISGQAISLNVLANDTDSSGTLTASSVLLSTSPNHGGTASVDPTTGAITYTSAAGFTGTETFSYTVADNNGARSAAGTVTITVIAASSVAPIAADDSANVLSGSSGIIDVLANDTSAAGSLVPSTVTLKAQPAHGTATVDAGTGNVLYTPAAGFIGSDTFKYAVTDSNSSTTNTATVTVYVGVAVGTNQNKSVTYKDGSGTTGVVTINKGVADVYFSGDGTLSVSKGKATVTGSSLAMNNIALIGTSAASTLSIKSAGNKGTLNLGGLTDTTTTNGTSVPGTIGKVIAPSTVLTGVINNNTINVGGMTTLQLKSMNTAEISVGGGTASFSLLVAGDVLGSDLSSGATIKQIKAASWQNNLNNVIDISAPVISNLTIAGVFEPDLDATGSTGATPALGTVKIGGAVDLGFWNVSGVANNLTIGSASNAWGASVTGALNKFTVRGGGLSSVISAATFGTLSIAGDLTGALTAGSAKSIKVTGNMSGGNLTLTNSTGTVLSSLKVSGAINGSTISSAGNIGTVTANALTSSVLIAGPDASLSLAGATTATIGSDVISSIKLAGKGTTGFSDSTILADTISSASLGSVNTSNGTTSGIGAASFGKLQLTVAGKPIKLSAAQLASQAAVDSALTGNSLGNFEVRVI